MLTSKNSLPQLWTARRLAQCCALAVGGVAQAIATLVLSVAAAALLGGDTGFANGHAKSLMIASALAAASLAFFQFRYAEVFAVSYIHDLRLAFMKHVLLAPVENSPRKVGHVLTRVVNDMSAVKLWLSRGLIAFVSVVPMIGTITAWLYFNAPSLLIVLSITVGVWSALVLIAMYPLTCAIRTTRNRRGAVAGFAGTIFQNRLDLLLNGRLGPTMMQLKRRSERLTRALITRATWSGVLRASGHLIFPVAAFLYLTIPMPSERQASPTLFFMIASFISAQLTVMSFGFEYFQGSRIALKRVANSLEKPALPVEGFTRMRSTDWQKDIVIHDLEFEDEASQPICVSASFKNGQLSILSGLSWGGRFKLVSALCGVAGENSLANISLGSRSFASINRPDIWRHVAAIGSGQFANGKADATLLGQSSRVSADEQTRICKRFGLCEAGPTRYSFENFNALKAARILLRKPRIVIIDDHGLLNDTPILNDLLEELEVRKATVLILRPVADSISNRFCATHIEMSV